MCPGRVTRWRILHSKPRALAADVASTRTPRVMNRTAMALAKVEARCRTRALR